MKTFSLCLALVVFSIGVSAATRADNDDLREVVKLLQKRIAALEEENVQVKSQVLQDSHKIRRLEEMAEQAVNDTNLAAQSTFLAIVNDTSVTIASGDPIIWDVAPINPGGNFNTALGLYQAPVHGYYTFSVHKMGNGYDGRFNFLVDELAYALFDMDLTNTGDSTPSTFATINVELMAGEIVRIENVGSTAIYGLDEGIIRSWFTGHLLYAL